MKRNKRLTKFVKCCYQIRGDKRIIVRCEDAKRIKLSYMMATDLRRSHSCNKKMWKTIKWKPIHPLSIHCLSIHPLSVQLSLHSLSQRAWDPVPCTVCHPPAGHYHTPINNVDNLEMPIKTQVFGLGRKPEYLEETTEAWGKTCKLYAQSEGCL